MTYLRVECKFIVFILGMISVFFRTVVAKIIKQIICIALDLTPHSLLAASSFHFLTIDQDAHFFLDTTRFVSPIYQHHDLHAERAPGNMGRSTIDT